MNRRKPDELGELLSAYLDDEVTAEERAEVDRLLAANAKVRKRLDDLRQAADATRALPVEPAPPDVLDAVTARLERETLLDGMDEEVTLARHRRPPLRATLSFAAMLAIAIGGGLYVSLQLTEPPDQETRLALNEGSKRGRSLQDAKKAVQRAEPSEKLGIPSERQPTTAFDTEARAEKEETQRGNGMPSEASQKADLYAELDAPKSALEQSSVDGADEKSESTELIAKTTQDMVAEMSAKMGGSPDGVMLADASRKEGDSELQQKSRKQSLAERAAGTLVELNVDADRFLRPTHIPPATFEQRLRSGEDTAELQTHNFAAEPLRLTVVTPDAAQQAVSVDRLNTLFAERGMTRLADDVGSLATGGEQFRRRSLVSRAAAAATRPEHRPLYFEGSAGVNFDADESGQRWVLARIPANWFREVFAAAVAADDGAVILQLGRWRVSGSEAACELAQRILDVPPEAETPQASAPRADLTEWLDRVARLLHDQPIPARRHKQPASVTPVAIGTDSVASAPASPRPAAQAQADAEMIASDDAIVIAAPTVDDRANVPADRTRGAARGIGGTEPESEEKAPARASDAQEALVTVVVELRIAPRQPAP